MLLTPPMLHTQPRHPSHSLARYPCQHATHARTPLTPGWYPCKHATHVTHASTNGTPFLKLIRKHSASNKPHIRNMTNLFLVNYSWPETFHEFTSQISIHRFNFIITEQFKDLWIRLWGVIKFIFVQLTKIIWT